MREYASSRIFRLSSFNPTHRQLILRSDPCTLADGASRVEIYFGNVSYVAVQPLMKGVVVRAASSMEQISVGDRFDIA